MLIIFQVRIDFVDTEMLTPTEGSCKDQYMSISGRCQAVTKRPCIMSQVFHINKHI